MPHVRAVFRAARVERFDPCLVPLPSTSWLGTLGLPQSTHEAWKPRLGLKER